ncbi:glycosyltransferase involved in cell wall biosynthesis [Salinibacter ruber]|uniref:hypothetical protein n=1 Tax=Salinibacter ruber TaxID=146919 RepID=UPI002167A811|nr:hypothetical protein [Salinibacter ruber]MCS3628943.1 glycosyltransferase involved in cell wall biosynthesis [Salinibacter ruber]MCS4145852.1 glycosyltransferase involved in cell wall biosynthesis [Salinibacter ruber]
MKVLVSCDVDTSGEENPYPFQLLRALQLHPEVDFVQHGTAWLQISEASFDVIHVQWPEALSHWEEPSRKDLVQIRRQLQYWRREATIVSTVHNEHPHGDDANAYWDLYRLVYEMSDGIIHLGSTSKQVLRERYPEQMEAARETVIVHGDYSWFPDSVSRTEARDRLGIDQDRNVILSFGSHRLRDERRLLLRGFGHADISRKQLLVAGQLPNSSRRRFSHYVQRLPFWMRPRVTLREGFIPSDQVQLYLRAADTLVISRVQALNSGNVALGLTFGVVVAGPEHGVIGEMLRQTGNPTFNAHSPESMGKALEEAISLGEEKGVENRKYAEEHLNWRTVGNQHVSFYEQLLNAETDG